MPARSGGSPPRRALGSVATRNPVQIVGRHACLRRIRNRVEVALVGRTDGEEGIRADLEAVAEQESVLWVNVATTQ
jgi:hypothetical protein